MGDPDVALSASEVHDPEEVLILWLRIPDAAMATKAAAEDMAEAIAAIVNEERHLNGRAFPEVEVVYATRSEYRRG